LQQRAIDAGHKLASHILTGETMGALTTHVLDTAAGKPGAGIVVELFRLGTSRTLLMSATTNSDGRCDQPLLQGMEFERGQYELVFHAGSYFARQAGMESAERTQQQHAQQQPGLPFLDQVVVRFGVADARQNYHVPLLISPFGYTTYRGS
jgi:5-hydroxyisourate hydrolase